MVSSLHNPLFILAGCRLAPLCLSLLLPVALLARSTNEPAHPILSISGSGSGASTILISGPYTVLAQVARVLNRPDYIIWMEQYLDATVRQKIRRDGVLEEGLGYSIGYLNENLSGAQATRDHFLTRPADTPTLVGISNRVGSYVSTLQYGQAQWAAGSLPNGQLPSFGDTPFNNYFASHTTGNSGLLPACGHVARGAGSGSQAVQLFAPGAGCFVQPFCGAERQSGHRRQRDEPDHYRHPAGGPDRLGHDYGFSDRRGVDQQPYV